MSGYKLKVLNENPLNPVDLNQIKGGLSDSVDPDCFINICKCNKQYTCNGNVPNCPQDSVVCGADALPVCPSDGIICGTDYVCPSDGITCPKNYIMI